MTRTIFFFIAFLAAGTLAAQQQKEVALNTDRNPKYPSESILPREKRDKVIRTAKRVLNEYNRFATMLDEKEKRVTDASVNKFNKLFTNSAYVYKDFAENHPQKNLIGNNTYADGVFNRFETKGLEFEIEDAWLKEIKHDASGYYQAIVVVKKVMYSYASSTLGKAETWPSGKPFNLEMTIDIPKNDLDFGLILLIQRPCSGRECEAAEDYNTFWEGSIGGGWNLWSATESQFWSDMVAAQEQRTSGGNDAKIATQSLASSLNFSVGGMFRTNRFLNRESSPRKKLFLAAGLRFSQISLKSTIDDYSIGFFKTRAPGFGFDYSRYAGRVNAVQTDKIGLLEIPLGLSFRLKKGEKMNFLVDFLIVPAIPVSNKSSVDGLGNYAFALDTFLSDRDGALDNEPLDSQTWNDVNDIFKTGPDQKLAPETKFNTSLGLSARLSPTLFLDQVNDDPAWGFSIGLDLGYMLKAPIKFEEITLENALYRFPDPADDEAGKQENRSATQHIYSGISGLSVGVRVGVHYRIAKRV